MKIIVWLLLIQDPKMSDRLGGEIVRAFPSKIECVAALASYTHGMCFSFEGNTLDEGVKHMDDEKWGAYVK